jgi:diguanylate cyclase (GGDEF)-like protein/excisionase family DNA binding protein
MGSPSTPTTDRRWLRLGSAAELLGVSVNTLRRWSDAGKVACYRSAGGHRRYRRADIDALLRDGAGTAASRRGARPVAPSTAAARIAALEARNRDLQLLVEAGIEEASHLSTDDVLQSVARRLARLTRSPVADIYAVEGETLRALVSYDHGVFDRAWEGTTVRLRDFPCSAIAVGQRRVSLAASLDDPVLTPTGRKSLEKWGYQSQLAAPLVARDAVIGILELSDYVPRDFSEHLELIEGLAHVAGRALDNAALFDEIRRRNEILHELVEFGALATRAGDVTELLRIAARRLVETLGAADCDVFTLEGDTTLLSRVSYDRNGYDDDSVGHSLRVDDFPNVKMAIESQQIAVIASPDDPRIDVEERRVFAEWGFKSNLSLPLVVDGVVHGLIDIYDDEPGDYAEYLDFLMTVGQLLAGALGKARLLERLEGSNDELHQLVDSGLEFGSSLELDDVLYSVAGRMRGLAGAQECEVSGLEGSELVVRICVGGDGRRDGKTGVRRSADAHRATQRAIATRQPVAVRDAADGLNAEERTILLESGHRASIHLPLIVRGEVIGLVALYDSRAREFPRVQLLQGLAQIAAQAMDNARLYDEIKRMHLGNLKALSSALNAKDYYTLGHAARVGAYMVLLGHELGWSDETIHQVEEAAYLHDIGKIGVADRVLLKPSGLNSREWDLMRQHPIFSADILRPLFADDLVLGVRHHHEHWDGTGYPDGRAAEAIPLVARAMCVADSYDAMSFRRPYRQALRYHEALAELDHCSGTQFDPQMVVAFKRVLARLHEQRDLACEVAALAAARIDPDEHATLRVALDESRPEYLHIAAELRAVRDDHPQVRYLTTVVVGADAKATIVVDAEQAPDERAPLGSEIFADDELLETFAGASPDVNVLYVDQWGVWVSGLATVRDRRGEVVAIVQADIPPAGLSGAEMAGLRSDVAQAFAAMFQAAAARLGRTELDAITDGLTGLYNHRYLHERLSEEIERARQDNRSLSLLFCGLDRFKDFNDRYGHSAGDDALRSVARVIDGCIRHVDLAARYGGEEFAVILLGSDADAAADVAGRVRREVAASQPIAGNDAHVTISIGVASFPADAGLKEELLDKADWAMRLAKRRGRDRVVAFTSGQSDDAPAELGLAASHTSWAALADAVDAKQHTAGARSRAMARIAAQVAAELGLDGAAGRQVVEAARLSDIGEIGVPDDVLNKPGELTPDERRLIREHPLAGERLLRGLGASEPLTQAVVHHHERFDGTGYPSGLAGEAIPLPSRIVLVAAAWCAMTGRRPHAPQLDAGQALAELRRCAGTQFDGRVVEALARAVAGERDAPRQD